MARNPNHPRTEIAPPGRCVCAARELVGMWQPVSPAAPRAQENSNKPSTKNPLTGAGTIPILLPGCHGRALLCTTTLSGGCGSSPCPPSSPRSRSRIHGCFSSHVFLSLPSEGGGGSGRATDGEAPPAPAHYLLTVLQLLFPARRASFGYAGCPQQPLARGCFKRRQEDKRDEVQRPLPWQTLAVCCSCKAPALVPV